MAKCKDIITNYIIHISGKYEECNGYWIASPSAKGAYYMIAVDSENREYNENITLSNYGLRPVVSLPATTLLKWNESNNIWEIY